MTTAPIYLDNAATTRVAPEVAKVVCSAMVETHGNPASAHLFGIAADGLVNKARTTLSRALGDEGESHGRLLWTSGGTESDALGTLGAARARKQHGKKIVISAVEHSAVRESAKILEAEGFSITTIPVDSSGRVDVDKFVAAASDGAAVACLMLVNNEIGVVQPVAEVAKRLASCDVHFHCDAVQALGKIAIDVVALGVDSLAVAAHKLHGPKGVGALWCKHSAKIDPLWQGGGQQYGLRSGTLNVPGISGFGAALDLALQELPARQDRFRGYKKTLVEACEANQLRFLVNGGEAETASHILSLAFDGCPAEPLMHMLESRGVLVSAGSACSERDRKPSFVLDAIALDPGYATLRISFGRDTEPAQIDLAASVIVDAVQEFQR